MPATSIRNGAASRQIPALHGANRLGTFGRASRTMPLANVGNMTAFDSAGMHRPAK